MNEESVFAHAIDIASPAERNDYLDDACAGNVVLRDRLERLIDAHLQPDSRLDAPPVDMAAKAAAQIVAESVGSTIGPYRLLELIGEGGMGLVFMAEQQQPIRRMVALKIIKPGMDSRQIVLRFEAERQTLALMDHPHIAKILDSGTTDSGRPYFVMELVRGIAVTDYCDQAGLDPRQRLELFLTICQAVQHAHQHGIIHRDLKPANILVTMHDDVPVAKVIDFGVAKALHRRLIEQTLFTNFAQLVGTPVYMSPEQAQMSNLDVDTRSDVYSLGVLLYELLTGTTPFDRDRLRQLGYDEMRRIIREEEPPSMSSRVSTLAAEKLCTVSQRRGTDARRLVSALRGELDWIVMKALEKNRERRFESASALAADVQRYLDHQPIEAHPPSAMYRARKFARRNRTLLTTCLLVGMAMVAGTAASLWQAHEANRARDLADERLENEKQAHLDADTQRQQASENLRQALDAVDQMLTRVADERLASIPGAEPVRRELFQDALRFYDDFFRRAPDSAQLRASTAKAWSRVAELYDFFEDNLAAKTARQTSIDKWQALLSENPDDAQTQASLAATYFRFGEKNAGLPAMETALALWRDLARRFPTNLDYEWETATLEFSTAKTDNDSRHAIDHLRDLSLRAPNAAKEAQLCIALNVFAGRLQRQKASNDEVESLHAEAVRRAEELALADAPPAVVLRQLIEARDWYGGFLQGQGRFADAELQFRRALEVGRRLPQLNVQNTYDIFPLATVEISLANLLLRDGRYSEAISLYRKAGDRMRPVAFFPGPNAMGEDRTRDADQKLLNTLSQLAHWQLGHKEQAQDCFRQAVDWMNKSKPTDGELLSFRAEAEELLGVKELPEARSAAGDE